MNRRPLLHLSLGVVATLAAACSSDAPELLSPGTDAGRTAAICNSAVFERIEDCRPLFSELLTCFSPSGSCETAGSLLSPTTRYANGARIEQEVGAGTSVTQRYYSPSGALCGTQVIETEGQTSITLTLPGGRSDQFDVSVSGDDGVSYECQDGSTLMLGPSDTEALQACTGVTECTSGDFEFTLICSADNDCATGFECCGGLCVGAGDCFLPETCSSNADCTAAGTVCCGEGDGGLGSCEPREECTDGDCETDADCAALDAECCEGTCSFAGEFCEGQCRDDDDCDATVPYCCLKNEGASFCTNEASSCWEGIACTETDDCGAGSADGLLCCEDADDGSLSCQDFEGCYGGRLCSTDAECGGLTCCSRADFGGQSLCATPIVCGSFLPCESSDDCTGGTLCCPSFGNLCVDPELCIQ